MREASRVILMCTFTFQSKPPVVPWIWRQWGPVIVGDTADDYFGTSVALSADAKTLVVGAPGYSRNSKKKGYLKVYRSDEGVGNRTQLGQTIYGDATEDQAGYSVDITADGKTIVLGYPGNRGNDDRPGYVRVFFLESSDDLDTVSWKQRGQDIIGEAIGDRFGVSVSISKDGKMIAIGAESNDGNGEDSGHVRIFRLEDDGTSWVQIGQAINGEAAGDRSGMSVSLSWDGETVTVGSRHNDVNRKDSGQVRVFRINSEGSSWERLGQIMYGDKAEDYMGESVYISPDGNLSP